MNRLGTICVLSIAVTGAACARDAQTTTTTTPYVLVLPPEVEAPRELPPKTRVLEASSVKRTKSERALQRARKRLESAKALYLDLAFEESLKELDRAQKALEKPPWGAASFRLLREVTLLRAQNALALGNEEMLAKSLRQAILIDPNARLSAASFPPDFRETYEEARQSLRTEPAEAVSVTASVPESEVNINGRAAGLTPLTARLHTIRYYLEIDAFGYRQQHEVVDIDQRGTAPIHFELEPLTRPELTRVLSELDTSAIEALDEEQRRLFSAGGAPDATVHVSRARRTWTGLLLDPTTGAIAGRATTDAIASENALGDLVASLRADGLDRDVEKPLVRKWWFWTAIIGGAAAVGLTTYFLVRDQPDPQLVFRNP